VNRDILKEQLKAWNCRCAAVNSVQKGLKALEVAGKKGVKIDLIIIDYHMPKLNGEDFVNYIKSKDALKHIPVLMLTSVADDASAIRMKGRGLDAYLTKPPRTAILHKTLAGMLSKKATISCEKSPEHNSGLAVPEQSNHLNEMSRQKKSGR